MRPEEDIPVTMLEDGRQAVLRYLTVSEADRDGTVKRIVAAPDTEVDAKDLLLELE